MNFNTEYSAEHAVRGSIRRIAGDRRFVLVPERMICIAAAMLALLGPAAHGQGNPSCNALAPDHNCNELSGLNKAECLLTAGSDLLINFRQLGLGLDDLATVYPQHRDELWCAESLFRDGLNVFGQEERALVGLTETLPWLIKGQMLLGNKLFSEAVNMRFSSGCSPNDPNCVDPDEPFPAPPPVGNEVDLLRQTLSAYEIGLEVFDDLRSSPEAFDASSFRGLAKVLTRALRAHVALSERIFKFGGDSWLARAEAADELRNSVQRGYLGAAMLAGAQSEEEFRSTGGDKMGIRLAPAVNLFNKIADGVNPVGYHAEYTPFLPYFHANPNASLRSIAYRFAGMEDSIGARWWDAEARRTTRQTDVDQTTLANELASLRIRVQNALFDLTGVDPTLPEYFQDPVNLSSEQHIDAYLSAAAVGTGLIGQELAARNEALASFDAANLALQNIPRRIQIEQERAGGVAWAINEAGDRLAALAVSEGLARSVWVSRSATGGVGFGDGGVGLIASTVVKVTFSPNEFWIADINRLRELTRALQQTRIEGINSAATIKNLLLEQAEHAVALEVHEARIRQANLRIEDSGRKVLSLLDDWEQSLGDINTAYYSNPAYRLEMVHAVGRAHQALGLARGWSFLAAKALGYEWADEFPGEVVFPAPYDSIDGPESVFEQVNAEGVIDFIVALDLYDTEMMLDFGVGGGAGNTIISVREDVLGYSDWDELSEDWYPEAVRQENVGLFKEFIRDHWDDEEGVIEFEFDLSITDEVFFPIRIDLDSNYWNVKVQGVAANLHGGGDFVQQWTPIARMTLSLGGMSTLRHHSANWQPTDPTGDALMRYDLEAMDEDGNLRELPLETYVQGFPTPPAEPVFDSGLALLSVAATKWRITVFPSAPNNDSLNFDDLDDIELWIRWHYGPPER